MKKLKKKKNLTKKPFLCKLLIFLEIFKNSKTINIIKTMYIRNFAQIFYELHKRYLNLLFIFFFQKVYFFGLRHYFIINENKKSSYFLCNL